MNDSGGEVDNNKMERMKKIASLGKVLLMICVFVFAFLFVVRGSGGGDIVSTYYKPWLHHRHHYYRRYHLLKTIYTSGLVEELQQKSEVHQDLGDKEAGIFKNKAPSDVTNLKNVYWAVSNQKRSPFVEALSSQNGVDNGNYQLSYLGFS